MEEIKTIKVLNKSVKKILDDFRNGYQNYLDFEEDYEFLEFYEKEELISILDFCIKECKTVEFVEV